jgi:hypothetical protein
MCEKWDLSPHVGIFSHTIPKYGMFHYEAGKILIRFISNLTIDKNAG